MPLIQSDFYLYNIKGTKAFSIERRRTLIKAKEKEVQRKSTVPISSKLMYIGAAVIILIAVAFLINNIILFKNAVAQYVAQGYPSADVVKQLIPNQLLPGIFEPVAVYGGIAFILLGAGIINQKVSKCLKILAKDEVASTDIDNSGEAHITEEAADETTKE